MIADELRAAMRRWVTGVSVVTFDTAQGVHGITINSFTSVSLDPPLILICIRNHAQAHGLLLRSGRFCVNVLGLQQRSLAVHYAGRRIQPGPPGRIGTTPQGTPCLEGALAQVDCALAATTPAGDHTIFLGHVQGVRVTGDGAPLLFAAGAYAALGQEWETLARSNTRTAETTTLARRDSFKRAVAKASVPAWHSDQYRARASRDNRRARHAGSCDGSRCGRRAGIHVTRRTEAT